MTETRILTEEEFDAEFTLVEFADGGQVTTDRQVMRQYPESQVWTLVDDGEGGMALCSGFAVVNYVGWQVTLEPHPGGNGDIVVEIPDDLVRCVHCYDTKDTVDDENCPESPSGKHEWNEEEDADE